jgi:hypothetical protein
LLLVRIKFLIDEPLIVKDISLSIELSTNYYIECYRTINSTRLLEVDKNRGLSFDCNKKMLAKNQG